MPRIKKDIYCCVCKWQGITKTNDFENIQEYFALHRFPQTKGKRKEWLSALNLTRADFKLDPYRADLRICSRHFPLEAVYLIAGKLRLRDGAIPNLNCSLNIKKIQNSSNKAPEKESNSPSPSSLSSSLSLPSSSSESERDPIPDIRKRLRKRPPPAQNNMSKKRRADVPANEPADKDRKESLKNAEIKSLKKQLADAEEKIKELENLSEKRKQAEPSVGYNREAFLKSHIVILEKRVADAEEKLKVLQTHCKNLCDIVNSQKETISYLRGKIIASEEETAMLETNE